MGESVKLEDVLDAVDAVIRQRVPLHLQGNTALDEVRERLSALPRAGEGGEVERLRAELKDLYRAYVSTLEAGRDRIISLGGNCDSVERMEEGDPALIKARAALHSSREG